MLEAFDFALGGGVVRLAVLLDDVESAEFMFEGVLAGPAGETGCVDHPVVGEG